MNNDWQPCEMKVFWGEIAPSDHILQVYENEEEFLNLLEGFVTSEIDNGDCVILIATGSHKALENQIVLNGYDVNALMQTDRYLPLNAEEDNEIYGYRMAL